MNVAQQWKYKVAVVQAVQIKDLASDMTLAIPVWVIDNVKLTENVDDTSWIVKKPDDSVAVYSDDDFRAEFEQ